MGCASVTLLTIVTFLICMNLYVFLVFVFCFGLLVGLSFMTPILTGQSTTCMVDGAVCTCDGECVCGNRTFSQTICDSQSLYIKNDA